MELAILEDVGFTKGEIKVYLALLTLGESTTGNIISTSEISSSKVYEILEKLSKKGLVSHVFKEKTKYFQAASPNRIIDYLEKQRRVLENTRKEAEKTVEQLAKVQKLDASSQTAVVYEGFEGIKAVFSKILEELNKNDEYYVFTVDEEASSKELKNFFLQHHKRRIYKGIKVKLLSRKTLRKEIKKNYPSYRLSERRFIDLAFPTGVFIFKGHVMHFTYFPKPTLIVCNSVQHYESYRTFFEELWARAHA